MGGLQSPTMRAGSFRSENQKAIPLSGTSPEAIWHLAYDTKTYTSAATVSLNFFDSVNVGTLDLTNMEVGGQFPAPQVFNIHGIMLDAWTAAPVSTSATNTGNINDLFLLQFVGRPRWTLTIQQKNYGPYPLSTLHGTGSPQIFGWSSDGAEILQAASTDRCPGWNYNGGITIPSQTAFQFNVTWAAAQTLTANWLLRVSMSGKLSRAVK